MSPLFTRPLFAGASIALTCVMVAASAPAAAAPVSGELYQMRVQVADLNLSSPAGQKTLTHRLDAAARAVCLEPDFFGEARCRAAAINRARAEIDQRADTTSFVAVAN